MVSPFSCLLLFVFCFVICLDSSVRIILMEECILNEFVFGGAVNRGYRFCMAPKVSPEEKKECTQRSRDLIISLKKYLF